MRRTWHHVISPSLSSLYSSEQPLNQTATFDLICGWETIRWGLFVLHQWSNRDWSDEELILNQSQSPATNFFNQVTDCICLDIVRWYLLLISELLIFIWLADKGKSSVDLRGNYSVSPKGFISLFHNLFLFYSDPQLNCNLLHYCKDSSRTCMGGFSLIQFMVIQVPEKVLEIRRNRNQIWPHPEVTWRETENFKLLLKTLFLPLTNCY